MKFDCQDGDCDMIIGHKMFQNEQLKKEQEEHIKTLLKQAKEKEKEVEQMTVVKQEEVEKALRDKIQVMKKLIVEQDGMV